MTDRKDSQRILEKIPPYTLICIVLAVLCLVSFVGAATMTVGPLKTLRETERLVQAIDRIEQSITNLDQISHRMLMVQYNRAISEEFLNLELTFQSAVSTAAISGLEDGIVRNLNELNNEFIPIMMILNNDIQTLNLLGLTAPTAPIANIPLVERFILNKRGENNNRALENTIANLNVMLVDFLSRYQDINREARRSLTHTAEKAFASLYITLFLYPVALLFLLAILALRKTRNAREAEVAALERSNTLEQLVAVRTAELENQNHRLLETQSLLVEREKMAALGQLVAGVAHEVNTPLGVGVTAASFLIDLVDDARENSPNRDILRETASLIMVNLQRASMLIQGFKQIAIDENEEAERVFDLVSYLSEDLIPSLKPGLRKSGNQIQLSGMKSLVMLNNPGAFAQIVGHLVFNASMHGYGKNESGIIMVQVEKDGEEGLLTISDMGKGMEQKTRSRMYDPFFTTNREAGGSGLGLMLVFNLVNHKLNGQIDCKTAPGKGTSFTIRFPIIRGE